MADLNVVCLTCLLPSNCNAQLIQSAYSIQDALRKHFWFTEDDLQQAIICQSCWEQVNNFYRFYSSVVELYRNQTSCLIDVKPEPEADAFDCLEEVLPECSSVKVKFEAEQLENLNSEYSVLSDKEHIESVENRAVFAYSYEDIGTHEPLNKPLLKKNSDQEVAKRKRVKCLSEDDRIKKHVKYICEQCGHESETFCLFKEHALQDHLKKSPFLVCCGRKYWKRNTLFQHVQFVNNPDKYRCHKCEKNFRGKRAYRCHRKLCHASVKRDHIFDCDKCPRSFVIEHHFKEHMENHARNWKCEKCNKKFINVTRLKQHASLAHSDLPLLTCDVCPQMFRLSSLMKLHKQTHDHQLYQLCPRMLEDRTSLSAQSKIMHSDAGGIHDEHQSTSLEADGGEVIPEKSHGKTLNVETVELYRDLQVVLTDYLQEGLTECPNKIADVETKPLISSIVVKEETVIEDPHKEIVQQEMEQDPKDSTRNVASTKVRCGTTDASVDAYIRTHVKFICDKCGQESLTFRLFMNHAIKKHHDEMAFVACCGKKFRAKNTLLQHVQMQNNPNIFRCEDCKIRYNSRPAYRRHLKNFHGNKQFKCEYCSKSYAFQYFLWEHMRKHLPEKQMKCPHCAQSFTTRQSIKCHFKRKHPDSPNFICDVCSEQFIMESWLLQHKKKHRELQCLLCPQRFSLRKNLRSHVFKQHPGMELPLTCHVCREVLPTKDALEAHKVQNHMRPNTSTDKKVTGQPEMESSTDDEEEQVMEEETEKVKEQNRSDNADDEVKIEDLDGWEL